MTYTIASVPSGLPITYAGSRYTTPFEVTTYINARRILEAPATATGGLRFDNWSDGATAVGEAVNEIVIADGDRVLTATYVDADAVTPAEEPVRRQRSGSGGGCHAHGGNRANGHTCDRRGSGGG